MSPLEDFLSPCVLCPNLCAVDRRKGEKGICGLADKLMVSSIQVHFGEERELVGKGGSGTIFFTGCNLKCLFCQNFDISWEMNGYAITAKELARSMVELQLQGAENINLVTPTPQVPMIAEAIGRARKSGLSIPIVYNSGGYENLEVLKRLEGLIDIYMPDFKYAHSDIARKLSGMESYGEIVREAIREMHRQVGDLKINNRGTATRGLLVRHLVLPGDLGDSKEVLDFLYGLSPDTFVNIMAQYRPCYRACEIPELKQRSVRSEWVEAVAYAESLGLTRGLR